MNIQDFDVEMVTAVLEFCYGSKIARKFLDSPERLFELFKAADKYFIDDLKLICINQLVCEHVFKLPIEAVWEMLVIAERMENADHLVQGCVAACEASMLSLLRNLEIPKAIFQNFSKTTIFTTKTLLVQLFTPSSKVTGIVELALFVNRIALL